MHALDRAVHALMVSSGNRNAQDAAVQDEFRYRVREVLRVLRDPDERMMAAGAEIIRNVRQEESEAARLNDAADTWRFMIDALLHEKA